VHNASDESLFDDLKHVVTAPREMLSHLVGSRTKEDREELQRILTHLPGIREGRAARALNKTTKAPEQLTPRSARATPLSARGTPALAPPAASAKVPAKPRGTTPRAAATPRGAAPGSATYVPLSTPRGGSVQQSRSSTPRSAGSAIIGQVRGASSPSIAEQAAVLKAMELLGDKTVRKPEDEKKSQAEATQRVIEKLAELGIDPEGMTATDILRIFYARGSGSSYWLANREAEKRLNIRASTPKSFVGVLTPRADREIRRARDLPVTNVHEYLDQWEIAFLGDICRSLRCFDEAAEGHSSEYMNKFTRRQYGAASGRKRHVRPET